MSKKTTRKKAWQFGHLGESIAAWTLRLKGYSILATRFKTPVGEVDLVARKGQLLVFVEVKTRRRQGMKEQLISSKQQRRIGRAASAFVQKHPETSGFAMRFDFILVRPWRMPLHIQNAWRPGNERF